MGSTVDPERTVELMPLSARDSVALVRRFMVLSEPDVLDETKRDQWRRLHDLMSNWAQMRAMQNSLLYPRELVRAFRSARQTVGLT